MLTEKASAAVVVVYAIFCVLTLGWCWWAYKKWLKDE